MKRRVVRERIELGLHLEFRLIHRLCCGVHRGDERRYRAMDIGQIIHIRIQMAEININRLLLLVCAKMDRSFLDMHLIDVKGKETADDRQPGAALAGLAVPRARVIDEIDLRILNQNLPDHLAMQQRAPLHGQHHTIGRKKRHRDIAGGF